MNKTFYISFFVFICLSASLIFGQSQVIKVWKDKVPGSVVDKNYKEQDLTDKTVIYRIKKVSEPTLRVYLPEKGNGAAVVICPGGGYTHLAYAKEGAATARWFKTIGVAAFILKYRLPSDLIMKNKSIGPLQDAQEAMRIVRRNAKKWKIDPDKIGIVGFSAGGHLAASLCTHYNARLYNSDSTSARPDFSVLLYPVISMRKNITHEGSRKSLLGPNPPEKEVKYFSDELNVKKNTPPAFIALAEDDKAVPLQNGISYFLALKNHHIDAELHIFMHGGHGFGLGKKGETQSFWPVICKNWLKALGII